MVRSKCLEKAVFASCVSDIIKASFVMLLAAGLCALLSWQLPAVVEGFATLTGMPDWALSAMGIAGSLLLAVTIIAERNGMYDMEHYMCNMYKAPNTIGAVLMLLSFGKQPDHFGLTLAGMYLLGAMCVWVKGNIQRSNPVWAFLPWRPNRHPLNLKPYGFVVAVSMVFAVILMQYALTSPYTYLLVDNGEPGAMYLAGVIGVSIMATYMIMRGAGNESRVAKTLHWMGYAMLGIGLLKFPNAPIAVLETMIFLFVTMEIRVRRYTIA